MTHFRLLIFIIITLTAIRSHADTPSTIHYDTRSGLSSRIVGGAVQDSLGLIWFATWNGLNCYDGYDFHSIRIRPGDRASIGTNLIRDILLSDDGQSIICHTDNDVFQFNLTDYSFSDVPSTLRDGYLARVGRTWKGMTDAQGNRWTADLSGLHKSFSTHHPATIVHGTEDAAPRAFLIDRAGILRMGLRRPSAGLLSVGPDSLTTLIPLPFVPYCIFQDSRGRIWTGGKPGGLMMLGGEIISTDTIYDICEDSRGRLWLATFGSGIKCVMKPGEKDMRVTSTLGGRKVRKLLITPDGLLVAATTDGLLSGRIPPSAPDKIKLRRLTRDGNNPGSLCSNALMSLALDSQGNLFIATESSGIDMINVRDLDDEVPVFHHFNEANGTLPSDFCTSMALVSDTLLIVAGTENAMLLNPATGQSINLSGEFWGDSCRFTEATPLQLPDGSWLLGGEKGTYRATLHNIFSRGYVPAVVFTTLAIDGGPEEFILPTKSEIRLPASSRNLTIGFAALDYVNNRDIIYRTALDGSPWTGGDRDRHITLYNLSPGLHLLRVQSSDRYGRWVDNVTELKIYVEAFWYERLWARILMAITAGGIIAVIVWTIIYVRRVKRQRAELLAKYLELMDHGDSADDPEKNTPTGIAPVAAKHKPEDEVFLQRVRHYTESHIADPDANVDEMAAASAVSRSTLNRRLRSLLGITAAQLLIDARMRHAASLLSDDSKSELPVADIAERCGYSDVHYFQRVFRKKHGLTPTEYRKTHHVSPDKTTSPQ